MSRAKAFNEGLEFNFFEEQVKLVESKFKLFRSEATTACNVRFVQENGQSSEPDSTAFLKVHFDQGVDASGLDVQTNAEKV